MATLKPKLLHTTLLEERVLIVRLCKMLPCSGPLQPSDLATISHNMAPGACFPTGGLLFEMYVLRWCRPHEFEKLAALMKDDGKLNEETSLLI